MIKSVMTHSTPDRASSNTTDGTNGSPQRVNNRLFSAIAQKTSRQSTSRSKSWRKFEGNVSAALRGKLQ
jgi:hypothetical protein